MKRPLCLFCAAAAAFLVIRSSAVNSVKTAALDRMQEALAEAASEEKTLIFDGVVADSSATADGVRLTMNHIILYPADAAEDNQGEFSPTSILTKFKEEKTAGGTPVYKDAICLDTALCVLVTAEEDRFRPGDRLFVRGTYSSFEPASNPGQFDAQAYYYAQDTLGSVYEANLTLLCEGNEGLPRILYNLRRALRLSYAKVMDEKDARTAAAISLGEKSWMEHAWKLVYQEGGIAHIIAISGLHITMIGMALYRMLRRLGLPFAAAALPCACAAGAYTLMTGCGVSAVRALFMFLLWLGAQVCGRKYDMKTSACVAALLICLQDARSAGQASFALSFAAVLSLAVLVPALQEIRLSGGRKIRRVKRAGKRRKFFTEWLCRMGRGLWITLSVGLGVWFGTLPVALAFFFQTAPWSILINLAVIPLMSAVMASALLAGVVGLFYIPAGVFLAAPLHYLLLLFETLCGLEQKLPLAIWVAGKPAMWRIAAYYAVLAAALLGSRLLTRAIRSGGVRRAAGLWRQGGGTGIHFALIWLAAGVSGILLMAIHIPAGLSVTCLDVGQGDGALLQLPDGTACLIDGGSSSVDSLWEYRIGQTVKYYGIRTLDYVFLSHADSDHISGITEYLETYVAGAYGNARGVTLKHLVLPPAADAEDFEELRRLAAQDGVAVMQMEAGDAVGNRKSGWSLTCLAPSADGLSGDRNEDSMVLRLEYGSFRMLFTGDLEGTSERALAASGVDLRCDVLKVGHHGSKNASSDTFLQAVQPAVSVISCGKNNRYGHPASETVERLECVETALYCTMDCGAVRIWSDGTAYRVRGYRK